MAAGVSGGCGGGDSRRRRCLPPAARDETVAGTMAARSFHRCSGSATGECCTTRNKYQSKATQK